MVTWVLYLCIGVVIGGVAGFYFAKLDDFSKKQKRALEEKLKTSESELLDYKLQVTHHFKETAELVNNMTESYQKVHEHLAIGAGTLCNNEVEVNRIKVTHNDHHKKTLANNKDNNLFPEANSSTDVEAPKTIADQESTRSEAAFDSATQASEAAPTPAELESDNEIKTDNKIKTNNAAGKNPAAVAPADKPANKPETNTPKSNKQNKNNALETRTAQTNTSATTNTTEPPTPASGVTETIAVTETMAVVDDDSIKHTPESVSVAEPTNATVTNDTKPNTANRTVH